MTEGTKMEYHVKDGSLKMTIVRVGSGWVARADWDRYLYTDPIRTLKEAKATSRDIIRRERETRT